MEEYLSFKLSDEFISKYRDREVSWGFPSGPGLTIGELIFLRTYSGKKEDGTKEKWWESARRVVEGVYSIQKDYVLNVINTVWDEEKAQRSAEEMYDLMYNFRFWAPGRGLENMGTKGVNGWGYSDRLYNCAFQSTVDGGTEPYAKLFIMSMRGVGVGFDTRGAGKDTFREPQGHFPYSIPDSTEGWVNSTKRLLESYFYGTALPKFNYDAIRPEGSPINSGGIAPGPGPLRNLHEKLNEYLPRYIGQAITSRNIVDICNLIGKAVVSGGKRRTALIALGEFGDEDFTYIKDFTRPENAERTDFKDGWAWSSNNSLIVNSDDEIDFDWYADRQLQGEPGLFIQDLVQDYGRMIDHKFYRPDAATGTNPCGEISLESGETCNVVTLNMDRMESKSDFLRTLKYLFLYAKSVTLMPTSWETTNVVSMRNRRIGCSLTGVIQFVQKYGKDSLIEWMHDGYREIEKWDNIYSRWLCVRESIKLTTIKPEGSASLLPGATPGVHYPTHNHYIRRIQFANYDPLLAELKEAGYYTAPVNGNGDTTTVVEIPTKGAVGVPTEREVTVEDKLEIALIAQRYWADNSVSFTLTFLPEEKDELARLLKKHWGKYKSITAMPIYLDESKAREMQLPYEGISEERYEELVGNLMGIDWSVAYGGDSLEAEGDAYCNSDHCVV